MMCKRFAMALLLVGVVMSIPCVSQEVEGRVSETINRGIQAARSQDWNAAIQAFDKARKESPFTAEIYLNLGLAHVNAGRAIVAIPWFEAYLAAAPHAANAAAVRQKITDSESEVLRQARLVYKTAIKTANNIPDAEARQDKLNFIAGSYARAGYIDDALALIATFSPRPDDGMAWNDHIISLGKHGLFNRVESIMRARGISPAAQDALWFRIHDEHDGYSGEHLLASQAVLRINDWYSRFDAVEWFRVRRYEAYFIPVLEVLWHNDESKQSDALTGMVHYWGDHGDSDCIERILPRCRDVKLRAKTLSMIAEGYLRKGNKASARSFAQKILTLAQENSEQAKQPSFVEYTIAAYAVLRDYETAVRKILSTDNIGKQFMFGTLVRIQLLNGDSCAETVELARAKSPDGTPSPWHEYALLAWSDHLLVRNKPKVALERCVPSSGIDSRLKLVTSISAHAMEYGALQVAEDVLPHFPGKDMPVDSVDGVYPNMQAKAELLLKLAMAHVQKDPGKASRFLADAQDALGYRGKTGWVPEAFQEYLGESLWEIASVRQCLRVPGSTPKPVAGKKLRAWISLAAKLSTDEELTDMTNTLTKAANVDLLIYNYEITERHKVELIPFELATVGGRLGQTSLRIHALRESLANTIDPSFHDAAKRGNVKTLKMLLAIDPDLVNIRDPFGFTPLHWAAFHGYHEAVEFLISKGAEVDASGPSGRTPLYLAAGLGHQEAASMLISKGANTAQKCVFDETPLHFAVSSGHSELVRLLLDHRADADPKARTGTTPLHVAAGANQAQTIRILLDKGVPVEGSSKSPHQSPLQVAATHGSYNAGQVLIDRGADVSRKDENGNRVIHFAAQGGNVQLLQALMRAGEDSAAHDNKDNWYPLHFAAKFGMIDACRFLLKQGTDVNTGTAGRMTSLHMASYLHKYEVVEFLLLNGANPQLKTAGGNTALDFAEIEPFPPLVELLEKHMK